MSEGAYLIVPDENKAAVFLNLKLVSNRERIPRGSHFFKENDFYMYACFVRAVEIFTHIEFANG